MAVHGPELVTNSKFTNGIDDWIASTNATTTTALVATNGTMDIQSAATSGDYGNALIEVNIKAGLTYSLTIEFVSGANAAGDWDDWIRVGTSNGTDATYHQDIWSALTYADPPTAKQGYNTIEWTQALNAKYLSVGARNDIFTLVIDNVSLRQVMPPLAGYPKTVDHPKITKLEFNEEVTGGNYMMVKSLGDNVTDYIQYRVKYINSADPTAIHSIKVSVGTTLQGPFSYVRHHSEGTGGASPVAGAQDCYTLVYEVED